MTSCICYPHAGAATVPAAHAHALRAALTCGSDLPRACLLQHRKIAVNFRDSALQKIFQMSLTACRQLLQQGTGQQPLQSEALALAQCCLNFDFVGTCLDDTTEDVTTIQVGGGLQCCDVSWCRAHQRACALCTIHQPHQQPNHLCAGTLHVLMMPSHNDATRV
jgi:hypothetical protein